MSEAFNSPRVAVVVVAVAAVAAVAVGDYFASEVSQIDGRCAILQKTMLILVQRKLYECASLQPSCYFF